MAENAKAPGRWRARWETAKRAVLRDPSVVLYHREPDGGASQAGTLRAAE